MVGFILDQDKESRGLELFPESNTITYNPEYSQEKADRFSAVLGEASPGTDVLTADISGGYQEKWNQLLKSREDTRILAQRNNILTQIAASRDPSAPVTLDDVAVVESLTNDELYSQDLGTILERQYSDFYTNIASSYDDNHIYKEASEEDPEGALDVLDRAQAPMQRSLAAKDILQEVQQRYDDTSWASWGADFAKTMVPLYSSIKMRERIDTPTASLLPGTNLEEQISQLYSLPPDQFKKTTRDIINELGDDNIILGLEFANAVVAYSSSDRMWSNVWSVVDVASVVPVATTAKLAKGMVKLGGAVVESPRNLAKISAAAGMNRVSAVSAVSKNILSGDFSGITTMRRIEEVQDRLPSLFAPRQFMQGGSKYMSAEAQARLEVSAQESASGVLRILQEGTGVDRLEPGQVTLAAQEAFEAITDLFPSNAHKVIDTQVIPASADKITNTAVMEVRFGRQDGQLFKYEATAKRYADTYIGLKTNDYEVIQDSLGGYYISVRRPLADVGDFRTQVIDTSLATPNTLNNSFARALRSPDYLVSEPNVRARGLAIGGTEYLTRVVDDVTKPFRGKSAQWYNEMDHMFRQSRTQKKYFNTAGDFEDSFYKKFKKPPTEDQYEAYFRYVQIGDLDYIIRDADKVKRMTAKGLEDFSMNIKVKEGNEVKSSIESVTGRTVDRLPIERREPFRVKIVQNGEVTHNFPNMMAKWSDRKELVETLLKDGYKIIQHAEGSMFTITKDFKRSSIKMKTLNRVEGGHLEQKYDFFIRQGKVEDREGAKVLLEDINLGTVPTEKQAKEVASILDQARLKVKNSDPDARRFIDENLPMSYGEFIKKVKTGDINLDVPIVATSSGQRSSEVLKYESIFGKDFYDSQSSGLNLLQDTSSKFTQQRSDNLLDVFTNDKGTVIKQDWESVLDPMDALASATRNMINVRMMEDYAIKSTNDWVQEFGHLMDVHPEVLKANPRYYMQNPLYKSGIDKDAAEASRLSMLSLFNQIDSMDSGRNVLKDKVLSKIFDVSGERGRQFLDDNWVTAKTTQDLIRKTAFNLKLGFWNPKQLFLQSTAVASTMAISPRSGTMGFRAMIPTRMALLSGSDEAVRGLHNKFGKIMGWQKDDWLSMVSSFKQSGFANVGGDHTYLDRMSLKTPGKQFMGGLKEGPVGKLASTHTVFFNEGELSSRIMAYATAYDEFLKRNPGKTPDRFQQGAILTRAKTFTQNMTRESNSRWQQGWPAVVTQFMSYHARIAEQMWDGGFGSGRKLSQKEKIQFLGTMSLLYGGGTAVSMTLPIFPTKDIIRDYMAEAGIDLDQYPLADAAIDGLITTGVEAMLGEEFDFSGYGPTGMPTLYDLMNGDSSWAEVMMGAGTGVMGDLGSSIANMAYGYNYADGEVTESDLLEVFRNIGTVDNFTKMFVALNTGKYLSRKGTYITDVTSQEAVMQALFGVSAERIQETFATSSALKRMNEARKSGLKEYEKYHRDALRARDADDEDSYRINMKRRDAVKAAYDLSPQEINQVRKRYFQEHPVDKQTDERMQRWNRKYNLFNTQQE